MTSPTLSEALDDRKEFDKEILCTPYRVATHIVKIYEVEIARVDNVHRDEIREIKL